MHTGINTYGTKSVIDKPHGPWDNTISYQSTVSSLMYAMIGTQPHIAHAVGVLSQFCMNPGQEHWNALKHVFCYLRGTSDFSIMLQGKAGAELTSYINLDWASEKNDHCSLTGYVFFICGGAISWSSKKQHSTAQSSTEAEYMAGTHAAKGVAWLRTFLLEIGQTQNSPTWLLVDNQSAIALVKNPEFHNWTKHIAVQYHFIREKIEEGELVLEYIPTGEHVADILRPPQGKFYQVYYWNEPLM